MKGMDRLRQRLERLLPSPSEEQRIAERACWRAIELIRERTRKGYDRHGKRFKGYAKSTREDRSKRGRQVDHVDLTDTGAMLGSLTVRPKGQGKAEITFGSPREAAKAAGHQFGKNNLPRREFFGLMKRERKAVVSIIQRQLRLFRGK